MSVPAFGPRDAKIAIVGEAPGADEVREGKPFVGKSGQFLRSFLMNAGIDPESVFYTNLCKERPPSNDLKQWYSDGLPSHPAAMDGLFDCADELREVNPNVIVAVGNYPHAMLTGKGRWNPKLGTFSGIQDWRGSICPATLAGIEGKKVVSTYHPAYILREGYSDHGTWQVDLQRVATQSKFPEITQHPKRIVIDPRGEARVDAHLHLLSDMSKTLTFDIEYIGNKLLCVGMTTHRDEAFVFVTRDAGDIAFVREILTSGIPLNAQNAMFDTSVLEWWYNIPCLQYLKHDTMLAQHAAYIELPKALDYLTSIYTEQMYYKDMVDWKLVKAGKQSLDILYQYNAIDTWTQHQIMEEQLADELTAPHINRTFNFEMQLVPPLWEMSKQGIKIDTEAMSTLKLDLLMDIEEIKSRLEPLAGDGFNVKSGPQVSAFLFDKLKVPEGGRTPGGQRKVDDSTLAACLAKCTNDLQRLSITDIRDLRERRDLISKFCEIELEQDGRMRGHYNPAGTNTGRLASRQFYPTGRGANQQNIPRDKRVRRVFIADPGKTFGYADLERAESFVVAHISGDLQMMENHMPGVDGHVRVGSYLFAIPEDQVTGDTRYLAKRTAHSGNYMIGPKRFMEAVNADANKTGISITFSEARRLLNKYTEYYSRLPEWWSDVERQLWKSRTLYNLLGRHRQFFDRIEASLPNAVAFAPQSTVGDTLNVALLNARGIISPYANMYCNVERIQHYAEVLRCCGYEPLSQIHDAIGFQFDEGREVEVAEAMEAVMEVPLKSPAFGEMFSIPTEIAFGPNWGDVKVWAKKEGVWALKAA